MVSWRTIGWALLLSVPPGIGVIGYSTMVIGGRVLEPVAMAAGGLVTALVFTFVVVAQRSGSPEPASVRKRLD